MLTPNQRTLNKNLNWKECEFSGKEEKLRDEEIRAKTEEIKKNGRKKGKGLDRKETITGIKAIWEAVKSYWGQYLRNNLVEKIRDKS